MSAAVVVKQMIMIALLISLGFYSYKRKMINDDATRGMSALIVNFTNPCLMIYSMLSSETRVSGRLLLAGLLSAVVTYMLLIVLAELVPRLLGVKLSQRYCYWMLCVFGNIGFIGIPLTEAVLGADALVYVCFHNLIFCLLIYTVGMAKIRREVDKGRTGDEINGEDVKKDPVKKYAVKGNVIKEAEGKRKNGVLYTVRRIINAGTVSAVAALIFYVAGWELPEVLMATCDYAGRATTFLSMMILGAAVARMNVRKALSDVRLIVFSAIRLIAIPVLILMVLKLFLNDSMIVNTSALMLAVPAGNMPLIMATQHRLEARELANGIVLTTVLSLITIPIVTLFC